jgi:hypothetical protein
MSGLGGKADVRAYAAERPVIATSGHSHLARAYKSTACCRRWLIHINACISVLRYETTFVFNPAFELD